MNTKQRRGRVKACLFSAAICIPLVAWAAHTSLPGSKFEIDTDANFTVDHPSGTIDWESTVGAGLTVVEDKPTGTNDDSFKGGTKEDSLNPQTTTGSIPNNKSDLKHFGVYQESNGGDWLHLFWTRVQNPSGTTLMDFELNAGTDGTYPPTATGASFPIRTAGDLLIEYKLAQGGITPELFMYTWLTAAAPGTSGCEASNSFPCWGDQVNLSAAGIAIGSINTTVADGDGVMVTAPVPSAQPIGSFDPYTFGEASINLSAIFPPGECRSFGWASLKSRSSDSFTAQMKDFIAPYPVNISNCANITVKKVDDQDPAQPLAGAEFKLYIDNLPRGTFGVEDEFVSTRTTNASGEAVWIDVFAGFYCVVETKAPAGHSLPTPPDNYQCDELVADSTGLDLEFVNPRQRGAIMITKTRKHAADGAGDHPHAGVTFTVSGGSLSSDVVVVTDSDGKACVDDLLLSSFSSDYTVVETVPTGYKADGSASKTVTVTTAATCLDDPYAGNTVSFSNTPLSNITVSFYSQIAGGTAAKISCGLADNPTDGTPDAYDDVSETSVDLLPGTYTCTVVIDP